MVRGTDSPVGRPRLTALRRIPPLKPSCCNLPREDHSPDKPFLSLEASWEWPSVEPSRQMPLLVNCS